MLPLSYYSAPALELAHMLLGCELVHNGPGGRTAGVIVETEAYLEDDEASHSFRGKSKRNEVMFGPGGFAYVYFTYGMHYCFNVVANSQRFAEAVLIRALEPTQGIDIMASRRQLTDTRNLCSGPAKLVQAMGIMPSDNGASLCSSKLYIQDRTSEPVIVTSPRIGITRAKNNPWRFFIRDNPFVSKYQTGRI